MILFVSVRDAPNLPGLPFPPFYPDLSRRKLLYHLDSRQQVLRNAARGECRLLSTEGKVGDDLVCKMRVHRSICVHIFKHRTARLVRHFLRPLADRSEGVEAGGD